VVINTHSLAVARLASSTVSAVFVGIWINLVTEETPGRTWWQTVTGLGPQNLLLAGAVGALAAVEVVARRRQNQASRDVAHRYRLLQQRQDRLLASSLGVFNELISKTLGVRCNARYFRRVVDEAGRVYLEQDRDLAVLIIPMPREYGFTRVGVDTPNFISGRSFLDRTPLYEELPVDHHPRYYTDDVGKMIEPTQRWVLVCPVLALDPRTNRHQYDRDPHGVIVFYGVELPTCEQNSEALGTAVRHAEQFADHMSHVLNMAELAESLRGSDE
jgi:hypothetical protein